MLHPPRWFIATFHDGTRDGVLTLNPGECCGWLTGRCTVALLETETMAVEIVDVPA